MKWIVKVDNYLTKKIRLFIPAYFTNFSFVGGVIYVLFFLFLSIIAFFLQFTTLKLLFITFLSLSLTTIVVFILKYTVKRKRISDNNSSFISNFDPYSFPSGHLSRLVCVILLFPNIFWYIFVIISVVIAFLSRIKIGYHYCLDLIFGLLIGSISVYFSYYVSDLFLTMIIKLC